MLRLLGERTLRRETEPEHARAKAPNSTGRRPGWRSTCCCKNRNWRCATGTPHELADSGIPGHRFAAQDLDRIHDEPEISTQNLLDRFNATTHENHLYKLAAMDPPMATMTTASERMFEDCLQRAAKTVY